MRLAQQRMVIDGQNPNSFPIVTHGLVLPSSRLLLDSIFDTQVWRAGPP
jgi:hypothetical protein